MVSIAKEYMQHPFTGCMLRPGEIYEDIDGNESKKVMGEEAVDAEEAETSEFIEVEKIDVAKIIEPEKSKIADETEPHEVSETVLKVKKNKGVAE